MALLRSDIASKMASLRQRLEEIREYKRILAEDGLKPDADDKQLESELIQKLLGLEKDLARMDAAKSRGGRRGPDDKKEKRPRVTTKASSKGKPSEIKADQGSRGTKSKGKKTGSKKSRGMLEGVKKDLSKVQPKRRQMG